jgi:hypothetical protein
MNIKKRAKIDDYFIYRDGGQICTKFRIMFQFDNGLYKYATFSNHRNVWDGFDSPSYETKRECIISLLDWIDLKANDRLAIIEQLEKESDIEPEWLVSMMNKSKKK